MLRCKAGCVYTRESTINVSFGDDRLEKACASNDALARRFGALAPIMARRLTSLRAAPTLADLTNVPGRFEPLRANRRGQFSMRLDRRFRLVFEVADERIPLNDDGVDLAAVTRVRVLEVVDYHDD